MPFDYYGVIAGDPARTHRSTGPRPLRADERPGIVDGRGRRGDGQAAASKRPPLWKLTGMPKRSLRATAPARAAASSRPQPVPQGHRGRRRRALPDRLRDGRHDRLSVHRRTGVTYIHNLFQNGAATLSGVRRDVPRAQAARRAAVRLSDITFVMVTGDGGMDIGMGPAIGAALRNHPMIILEYDNEGYMNTGSQLQLLDAARPPDLDEPRRPGRAGQVVPPQGHAADHGGDEHPVRLHGRRGLPATTWSRRRPRRSGTRRTRASSTARC